LKTIVTLIYMAFTVVVGGWIIVCFVAYL